MAKIKNMVLAHHKVLGETRRGVLKKLTKDVLCVDCGKRAKVYDHRDYNKPLDVEPVCIKCNSMRGKGKNGFSPYLKIYIPKEEEGTVKKILRMARLFDRPMSWVVWSLIHRKIKLNGGKIGK